MKTHVVFMYINHRSICRCGYNFGYVWPGTYTDHRVPSFVERKAAHFEARHPRRWAQGGIA